MAEDGSPANLFTHPSAIERRERSTPHQKLDTQKENLLKMTIALNVCFKADRLYRSNEDVLAADKIVYTKVYKDFLEQLDKYPNVGLLPAYDLMGGMVLLEMLLELRFWTPNIVLRRTDTVSSVINNVLSKC